MTEEKIFAQWFSDTLLIAYGKKIYYEHWGWGWYYDKEKESMSERASS